MKDLSYSTNIDSALICAKYSGKPLFILFTGYAGVSDRKRHYQIFKDPTIKKEIVENFTLTILYVDERTPLPENEIDTVMYGDHEKIIKTIGNKNAALQVLNYNSNMQPLYVCTDHHLNELKRMDYYTTQTPELFLKKLKHAQTLFGTLK